MVVGGRRTSGYSGGSRSTHAYLQLPPTFVCDSFRDPSSDPLGGSVIFTSSENQLCLDCSWEGRQSFEGDLELASLSEARLRGDLLKASFNQTRTFQGRSVKVRIIKQKERDIGDIETETEQHHGGHSVNPESTSFIVHTLLYFTPKGRGEVTDFINTV